MEYQYYEIVSHKTRFNTPNTLYVPIEDGCTGLNCTNCVIRIHFNTVIQPCNLLRTMFKRENAKGISAQDLIKQELTKQLLT